MTYIWFPTEITRDIIIFQGVLTKFFGLKKKSLPFQMDLYDIYIVPYMILWGYYNFPRSTNKILFLTKFPHLEKNC